MHPSIFHGFVLPSHPPLFLFRSVSLRSEKGRASALTKREHVEVEDLATSGRTFVCCRLEEPPSPSVKAALNSVSPTEISPCQNIRKGHVINRLPLAHSKGGGREAEKTSTFPRLSRGGEGNVGSARFFLLSNRDHLPNTDRGKAVNGEVYVPYKPGRKGHYHFPKGKYEVTSLLLAIINAWLCIERG